jgi:hypothetical protein
LKLDFKLTSVRVGPAHLLSFPGGNLMASQKFTNCCVAAIALVTAEYLSTPHSATIARLAFGAFCLAIHSFCFLAKASKFPVFLFNPKINSRFVERNFSASSRIVGRCLYLTGFMRFSDKYFFLLGQS